VALPSTPTLTLSLPSQLDVQLVSGMDQVPWTLSSCDLCTNASQVLGTMVTTRTISVQQTASAGREPQGAMETIMPVKGTWCAATMYAQLTVEVEEEVEEPIIVLVDFLKGMFVVLEVVADAVAQVAASCSEEQKCAALVPSPMQEAHAKILVMLVAWSLREVEVEEDAQTLKVGWMPVRR